MTDLDADNQWIVFYRCGHRICSQCFNELIHSVQESLQQPVKPYCPICTAVIEDTITLTDK